MDAALLEDALALAVREPDLASAIESLAGAGDPEALTDAMIEAVAADADEVERAAVSELGRLDTARGELEVGLEPYVRREASSDVDVAPRWQFLQVAAEVTDPRANLSREEIPAVITARSRPPDLAELGDAIVTSIATRDRAARATARDRVLELLDVLRRDLTARVLSRPDLPDEIMLRRARVDDARAAALRAVLERGVLPVCRAWVNARLDEFEHLGPRLSLELEATEAPGLAELPNPEHEVPTPDGERLERLLSQLPGGSVGISGPRGSGKTTLLRTFHEGRRRINGRAPGLAALVSAPVEYEPRDFVLHLFEQVCRAAGSDNRAGPATAHEPSFLRPRVNLATALGVVGAISLVAGTALLLTEAHFGDLDTKEQLALAVGALVAGLAVIPRRIHVVAGAALATPIVVIYVHDWQAAALLVAGVAWLALLAANVLAWRIMRLVVVLALVAGIVLGIGGLIGLDVGDRAATGAIVLVVAAMAVTALDREAGALAARGPVWPIAATASFAATFVGLVLMLFDAPPSTEVIVGFALTGCGLAWIAAAVGRPSLAVPTAVLPDPIPFAALRDAYFRKMAVPIEMFEQRLAEALITPESRSAAADVIARLRTWRIGGGQLDDAGLEDALIEARDRMPVGGEWMEIARFELRRRRTRHEAWRRDADAWMQRIRYQQSFSSTWSGKAGVTRPLTLEATRGRGLSVAEVPMTLPQIVIGLQECLRNASDVEPVVIAIDELDKMGSVEAAERFLNEVKAIFGVSNCYFLISVSEDAVANFERRGLPFRDVVDSSFDEVRRLSYLTLADSESLLAKRVVFLPYPFAALCHALSGGLARDLIRTTRALFDVRRTTGKTDMASLCRALVTAELTAKRDGIVTAVRGLSDRLDVSSVLRTLGSVPVEDLSLEGLEDELRLPFDAQGDHEPGQLAALALAALVREFVGFRYLCVTLVEIFADKVNFEVLRQMVQGLPTLHDFDELARARQGFTVDPVLAWQRISAVREAWELKVLPAPTLATVGQGVPVQANGGQS